MNEKQTRSCVREIVSREEKNTHGRGASSKGKPNGGSSKKAVAEGMTFGGWLVLSLGEPSISARGNKTILWSCKCECGVERLIPPGNLLRGLSTSCGCRKADMISRRFTKHGMAHTRKAGNIYRVWSSMRTRCNNPQSAAYHNYGGRGITICSEWDDFERFMSDMGPRPSLRHSIDRIDTNGPYCQSNCRWSTAKEQSNNRRRHRMIEHRGETKNLAQWASAYGLATQVLFNRLARGWSIERALSPSTRPKLQLHPTEQ